MSFFAVECSGMIGFMAVFTNRNQIGWGIRSTVFALYLVVDLQMYMGLTTDRTFVSVTVFDVSFDVVKPFGFPMLIILT